MRNSIYIFVLMLTILSCNSDDAHKVNSDMLGTWEWEGTHGGFAYHIHVTPESTGKTVQLELKDNYTFVLFENGNEILSGDYVISLKKSIYSVEEERYIQIIQNQEINNVVLEGIIRIYEDDKLDISDNNYDGISTGFIKIE